MEREQFIELPKITDQRGALSFIEAEKHIPFSIASAYLVYGDEQGCENNIHKIQEKVTVALSGEFFVSVNDGERIRRYTLTDPSQALYIPAKMSHSLEAFSSDAVCLVILSAPSPVELSTEKTGSKSTQFSVEDCSLIKSPLTPDNGENIPFLVKRIFYIYDIPSGEIRGMHAHKYCHEVLVATSGSFSVELDDGVTKKTVLLDRPDYGLHIPPGIWATEREYTSGSVCLALASDIYDAVNYIHSYSKFKKYRQHEN